ncbi:predicted protein [Plenodomus lingam JN3]|uniref:Predicted protein n=1 Tax=Leptosphaeria maculans (strain JN3 / isolate v23.1.3 / race Av1-4-5-6-7-8) TaxID=985895 RepID=E5ABJ7_LEPMJ|nr:predicted protein [Plenodomus lingam JN3]CBY01038.1 predicted protein [Plenodomus lingam JN3]
MHLGQDNNGAKSRVKPLQSACRQSHVNYIQDLSPMARYTEEELQHKCKHASVRLDLASSY